MDYKSNGQDKAVDLGPLQAVARFCADQGWCVKDAACMLDIELDCVDEAMVEHLVCQMAPNCEV